MDSYQDWLDARDNARQANSDYRESGRRSALAESHYYKVKAIEAAKLKADNTPVTFIETIIKGIDVVNDALLAYRLAEAEHNADKLQNLLYNQEEAHTYDQYKRAMAADSERF